MARNTLFCALGLLCILLTACGGGGTPSDGRASTQLPSVPPVAIACQDRAALCADHLLDGTVPVEVDDGFFLPVPGAVAALHEFTGTLNVQSAPTALGAQAAPSRSRFPAMSAQFVTVGDTLLPVDRGIISGSASLAWDIILSPH